MLKLIGLTGGPGCGKSAVLKIFEKFASWRVFDADKICHEIYSEPESPIVKAVAERWGKSFILADGTPDRTKIAARVFQNNEDREWLNSLFHPEIMRRIQRRMEECSCSSVIVIDAPLLFETGWERQMDLTVAVWSAPEIQMRRLLERGWTKEHAEKRIAAQFSAQKKLELADYGIINNSTIAVLEEQCLEFAKKIIF